MTTTTREQRLKREYHGRQGRIRLYNASEIDVENDHIYNAEVEVEN